MIGFTIHDRVTSTYSVPTFAYNEEDIKRRIAAAYRDSPFASDLEVYECCRFDTNAADVFIPDEPIMLFAVPDVLEEYYNE